MLMLRSVIYECIDTLCNTENAVYTRDRANWCKKLHNKLRIQIIIFKIIYLTTQRLYDDST